MTDTHDIHSKRTYRGKLIVEFRQHGVMDENGWVLLKSLQLLLKTLLVFFTAIPGGNWLEKCFSCSITSLKDNHLNTHPNTSKEDGGWEPKKRIYKRYRLTTGHYTLNTIYDTLPVVATAQCPCFVWGCHKAVAVAVGRHRQTSQLPWCWQKQMRETPDSQRKRSLHHPWSAGHNIWKEERRYREWQKYDFTTKPVNLLRVIRSKQMCSYFLRLWNCLTGQSSSKSFWLTSRGARRNLLFDINSSIICFFIPFACRDGKKTKSEETF